MNLSAVIRQLALPWVLVVRKPDLGLWTYMAAKLIEEEQVFAFFKLRHLAYNAI